MISAGKDRVRSALFVIWIYVAVDCGPLALKRANRDTVLAHDFSDAVAKHERFARHVETFVYIDLTVSSLAFNQCQVLCVEQDGEQVTNHILDALSLDLGLSDTAVDRK